MLVSARELMAKSSLTIHQKIRVKANIFWYLKLNQVLQLTESNSVCLAPYYGILLAAQGRVVANAENFKAAFGKSQYEYENNIN